MQTIKCVVVGDSVAGKRELLINYTTGKEGDVFDNYAITVMMGGEPYTLGLFETTGQEDYDRLRPLSYPQTDVFIICFSIAHPDSFTNVLEKWAPEVKHHCPKTPFVLVGTKKHLRGDKETKQRLGKTNDKPVGEKDGWKMAKRIGAVTCCECSAEHGVGVKEVFDAAMLAVVDSGYNPVELWSEHLKAEEKLWSKRERMIKKEMRPVSQSRLVVCGAGRAGKSCLLRTFLNMLFTDTASTRGVDFSHVVCMGTRGLHSSLWAWQLCDDVHQLDLQCGAHALMQKQEVGDQSALHNRSQHTTNLRHIMPKRKQHLRPDGSLSAAAEAGKQAFAELRHRDDLIEAASQQDMHFLDIWDLAGQASYMAFQQVVIKDGERCAYPIVYNSSTFLEETTSELHVIEQWLDFLYDISGDEDFLFYAVGCQIDKVPPELRDVHKQKVKQKIRRKLQHKPYAHRLKDDELFFFVDNTRSGKQGVDSDEDADQLHCRITNDLFTFCQKQSVPLRWLSFSTPIQKLAMDQPSIPLEEALWLAKEVCRITDKAEVKEMLSYYHRLGRLLFYDFIDVKSNVILDVHGFLKVISALFLVCDSNVDNGPWQVVVNRLQNEGILQADLAEHIWKRDVSNFEDLFNSKDKQVFIFRIMEKYALLFNTKGEMYLHEGTGTSQAFFVPSLAPSVEGTGLVAALTGLCTGPPIFLKSGDMLVWHRKFTLCMFWQIIVRVLQRVQPTPSDMEVVKLTRTSAILPSTSMPHIIHLVYQKNGVWLSLHWPQRMESDLATVSVTTLKIVRGELCELISNRSQPRRALAGHLEEPVIACANHSHCKMASPGSSVLPVVHLDGHTCSACKELAIDDVKETKAFWSSDTGRKAGWRKAVSFGRDVHSSSKHRQPQREAAPQREGISTDRDLHIGPVPIREQTGEVPPRALQKVADGIASILECIRLAANLDFDKIEINKISHRTDRVEFVAMDLLLQWSLAKTERATCSVLHSALITIDRRDLAEKFEELLASEGILLDTAATV